MENKFLLIDGNNLLFKSYYALPLLYNFKGEVSNAVFGFCTTLCKVITTYKPTHIVVALDAGKKTFRHEMYSEYKGTRKETPQELKQQFPILKRMLEAMHIKTISLEGYEADDIIGTLSKKYNVETKILSGDRDLLQLISNTTDVWLSKKGATDVEIANLEWLKNTMGLTSPSQIVDLKSIMGDTSDNIPGVKGIGEKGALNLIQKYGTLENVYQNLEQISGKQKQYLEEHKDEAFMSYKLATINTSIPIDDDFDNFTYSFPFTNEVKKLFEEYQFNSLLKRTDLFAEEEDIKDEKQENTQKTIEDENELQKILNDNYDKDIAFCIQENINFAFDEKQNYVIKINADLFSKCIPLENALKLLKKNLENSQTTKIFLDSKKDRKLLLKYGIKTNGPIYDVGLAGYILSCGDKSATMQIKQANLLIEEKFSQQKKLIDTNLNSLYYNLELPLSSVLLTMENNGFKVDVDMLTRLNEEFEKQISILQQEIITLAGETFNINSPKQVAYILFEKLGLRSPTKKQSTASETLEEIESDHPIIPLILEYRKVQKLNSYLVSYKELIKQDNLIYTNFNQMVTSTGRLSSSEPNLQNIPVRDEIGRNLRKIFISRFENGKIISADYNQIELRLIAHFSEDEVLINAYKNGKDIHTQTAMEIFNLKEDEITPTIRRLAKSINFGIIYGISDYGLAKNIKSSYITAAQYISNYFAKFPKIKTYLDSNVAFAKQNGYIKTLFNRIRKIPEINSSKYLIRQFGERAAMNMPLQGTASDIIKIAMIKIQNKIETKELKSKLILQIHDELIIDCYPGEEEIITNLLKEEMENVIHLNVPLKVEVGIGNNLYECK